MFETAQSIEGRIASSKTALSGSVEGTGFQRVLKAPVNQFPVDLTEAACVGYWSVGVIEVKGLIRFGDRDNTSFSPLVWIAGPVQVVKEVKEV